MPTSPIWYYFFISSSLLGSDSSASRPLAFLRALIHRRGDQLPIVHEDRKVSVLVSEMGTMSQSSQSEMERFS